ncbi:hypothetical protein NDU88_001663 [Pleurodeles waltl]|uniref:Uncharacterized protein n=1 Tax=Pleurodeles waltl TaxID=8319 RepID=A0AAV7R981_PLEWA|nr:hypothetical protein NDU88_001663 [Pleurodeles waltl]
MYSCKGNSQCAERCTSQPAHDLACTPLLSNHTLLSCEPPGTLTSGVQSRQCFRSRNYRNSCNHNDPPSGMLSGMQSALHSGPGGGQEVWASGGRASGSSGKRVSSGSSSGDDRLLLFRLPRVALR